MKIAAPMLVIFAGFTCIAQSPPTPAFDVASVRLFGEGEEIHGYPVRTSPDTLTINGISLKDFIQVAYQIPVTRIAGHGNSAHVNGRVSENVFENSWD